MIRTLIIDDEIRAREVLIKLLSMYCPMIEVVGQAEDVKSGTEAILKHRPDLVLLDIRMPDGTGFELLGRLPKINFRVVFITAFEEYALKAFKYNAIDYLLKPIDPEELTRAMSKIYNTIEHEDYTRRLRQMMDSFGNPVDSKAGRRLILKTAEGIHLVEADEIIAIEADQNYSRFFLTGGQKILVSKTIKEFDHHLKDMNFFRTHHSYLINPRHIRRYNREDLMLVMSDGLQIPVSFRKKGEVLHLLESL